MKEQTASKTFISATDNNDGQIGETLDQIRNYLERLSNPQQDPVAVSQESTTANISIEEETLILKSRIINIWDNNLKTRRLAYWQSHR